MMRHYFSAQRQVMVDECPARVGHWLDPGALAAARARSRKDLARRLAHVFRFICPGYYIPGKQDWGAF